MIRPFGLRDAWKIKQLQPRGVAFDLRRLLLRSSLPTSSAILGSLTRQSLGAITFVYYGSNRSDVRGFIQLAPRKGGSAWDLTYLAPSLDDRQGLPSTWCDLLRHAIQAGAERQVMRVYARPPEDGEMEHLLRRVGFALVGREEVFALTEPPPPTAPPRGFRLADRQDSWELRELHRKTMPPVVYQACGAWPMGDRSSTLLGMSHEQTDYVWTEKGEIVAHLGLAAGPKGYWIECVVRPHYRADLLPHIQHLVSLTDCSKSRPVYFAVPGYSVGLGWLLRTLGFGSYSQQLVMVAHTVHRVPVYKPVPASAMEGCPEMTPQ